MQRLRDYESATNLDVGELAEDDVLLLPVQLVRDGALVPLFFC